MAETHGKNRTERELIAALRTGEPSAFAELQARYLDAVFGYVLRRVPQREDAEDIVCEVFGPGLQSFASFRGDARLLTWLIGIARRKIADHLRRRNRPEVRESELPPGLPSPFDGADWTSAFSDEFLQREATVQAVRQAVARLPEIQREALLLRFAEELSLGEICAVMQRSEDSVKALLRRAKATLHALLSPEWSAGRSEETLPQSRMLVMHGEARKQNT